MKQKRSLKKLSLKKEMIASLNDLEQGNVMGGVVTTTKDTIQTITCPSDSCWTNTHCDSQPLRCPTVTCY